jgi:EAL domain-containing protein (putative c-di-GMP-specific phosphodiesterase class I)/GGDEF domain-containing protein
MSSLTLQERRHIDSVTNLPNRQQFIADYAPGEFDQLAMVTLTDASHFSALLRSLGHDYSEQFIRTGAARLSAQLPAGATMYYVSVLSLAFFCPPGPPDELFKTIAAAFAEPLICGGIPILIRIGLGITACSYHSTGSDALRAALSAAQDSRLRTLPWARYDAKRDQAHRRGFLLLSDLTEAIAAPDQLSLNFQPKYDLATGRPNSAEALLRWHHPLHGNISPAEFIPLAEATAHIHALTDWVLESAIAQAGLWQREQWRLNVAINVSPHNLSRAGFAAKVSGILARNQVDPSTIELEFTEGAVASNDAVVMAELQALRGVGMRIAIDDFGTGFANFSYMTTLPADILKIDQSFIRKISGDVRSAAVVRSLIDLAHQLGYVVVAEGIENAKAYRQLAGWNCDEGQGYFMSRPLAVTGFSELLRSGKIDVTGVDVV